MVRNKRWVLEAVDSWSGQSEGRLYDSYLEGWETVDEEIMAEARDARIELEGVLSLYPSPDTGNILVQDILGKYDVYKHRHRLE